ncbi:MAG TPA: hypothetical protein DCP63_10325, partial [Bacteroidetes bacterium]|nr:hypothetical protein [Bacteroidota bacterium]
LRSGQLEKVSYSIGYDIGRSLRQQTIDVSLDVMRKGTKEALYKILRKGLERAQDLLTPFRGVRVAR